MIRTRSLVRPFWRRMITVCRQAGHLPCQASFTTGSNLSTLLSRFQCQVRSVHTTQIPHLEIHCNLSRLCLEVRTACLSQKWSRASKAAFSSPALALNPPPHLVFQKTFLIPTRRHATHLMALENNAELTLDDTPMTEASESGTNASGGEVHVVLDRSKYVKHVRVQALRVPKGACHQLVKKLSKFKAEYPKVRNVLVEESRRETRLILLGENVSGPRLTGLPESLAEELQADPDLEIVEHEIVLDYDSYTAEQVLREVLPPGAEVPSSFETIGHVAHVNLRDELLPYKKIIGEVLLEKNFPRIRTILNKVGTIENEFRVPTFEVLAGDPSTVTEVKQHTARFQLDYARVYWNSRLEFEHSRLVEHFARDDVICDMFAGIGPFAIPAALKGCAVYANDLNPQSTHYLAINAKLNKVSHRVRVSTLDAREFVRSLVRPAENHSAVPQSAEAARTPADGSSPGVPSGRTGQRTVHDGSGIAEDGAGPSIASTAGAQQVGGAARQPQTNAAAQSENTPSRGGENGAETHPTEGAASVGGGPINGPGREHLGIGAQSLTAAGGTGGSKMQPPKAGEKAPKGKPLPMVRPPKEAVPERPRKIDHVVMNLPASGIEFLDVFNGLFDRAAWTSPLPRIHCYCFARAFETDADVIRRAEEALGGAIPEPVVWNVRDVAPNKTMLCVSFTLPSEVGYKQPLAASEGASQPRSVGHDSSGNGPHELLNHAKKSRVD